MGRGPLLLIPHSLRVKAVLLFNNSEEVKVSVPGGARAIMSNDGPRAAEESRTGLDCIVAFDAQKESNAGKHEFTCGH